MSLPRWRSILSVPINVDRFVEGAHRRQADAIQLDLEDSIPLSGKEDARGRLPQAISTVSQGGASVIVRINQPWRLAVRDLEAAVLPGVAAITLPKVEDPGRVRAISETIAELEAEVHRVYREVGTPQKDIWVVAHPVIQHARPTADQK